MTAYALYNEIDDYAADWLENLIAANLIAPGIVDRRSIEDLRGDDLRGFRQVHFFAGIGVWSYALRCAGIPDDFPVWTGSPPCQPFSAAGQRGGVDDERHLWPALFHLIEECRPARFLGEQVASKDGLGWLDLVQIDLEAAEYALGALDTCSAGSGAPHIRQRLRLCAYDTRSAAGWMGNAKRGISGWRSSETLGAQIAGRCVEDSGNNGFVDAGASIPVGMEHGTSDGRLERWAEPDRGSAAGGCGVIRLDHHHHQRLEGLGHGHRAETGHREGSLRPIATASGVEWVAHDDDDGFASNLQRGRDLSLDCGPDGERSRARSEPCGADEWLADADGGNTCAERQQSGRQQRQQQDDGGSSCRTPPNRPGPTNGFWRDADWLFCRDGKWRPVESGTFPLVDGSSFRLGSGSPFEGKSRQGMLKGYGNAVDAQATIDFIEACVGYRGADPVVAGSLEDILT